MVVNNKMLLNPLIGVDSLHPKGDLFKLPSSSQLIVQSFTETFQLAGMIMRLLAYGLFLATLHNINAVD